MTLKSTHCGVAGNRFHTCMTSATKEENKYRAGEYAPALLDKEMRQTAVKFNSRCMAFQIASYQKKKIGCESRELAGSDSSQGSLDTKKRLILSNDC